MQQTWLGQLLEISMPELAQVGRLAFYAGVALTLLAITARRLKMGFRASLVGACIAFVLAFVAVTDAFCIAGYTADDGACAWE